MPTGIEAIVMNPAYRLAEQLVAHALELAPMVVMLMRLAFLESERRCGILEGLRKHLPMMHRARWQGRKANSGMAFGWFVWERSYTGPTTVDRISWER
jgi:hypothetical protein